MSDLEANIVSAAYRWREVKTKVIMSGGSAVAHYAMQDAENHLLRTLAERDIEHQKMRTQTAAHKAAASIR